MKPKVSVLISCYNKALYIGKAIESACDQDYSRDKVEILVCHDGCTESCVDKSVKTINQYWGWNIGWGVNNLRCLTKNNGGTADCRNYLVKEASGDLFQHLDGDDFLEPHCVRERVDAYLRYPDCGMVYSDFYEYYDDTKKSVYSYRPHFDCLDNLHEYICGTNVMISRKAIETVGGYNKEFATIEDYELSLRISRQFPIFHMARSHYYYRSHINQKTVTMIKNNPDKLRDEYLRLHLIKKSLFGIL